MKYRATEADADRDVRNFLHHAPFGDQAERYAENRTAVLGLAALFRGNCPPSRELSLALTHLEEAKFWANAAIARNEVPDVKTSLTCDELAQCLEDDDCCKFVEKCCTEEEKARCNSVQAGTGVGGVIGLLRIAWPILQKYVLQWLNTKEQPA